MRVLLVWTDIHNCADQAYLHCGLAELSAYLKSLGHELFLYYSKQAVDREGFLRRIEEVRPDLLGFSAVTNQWQFIIQLVEASREAYPELPNLVGGYHPSLLPEEVIRHEVVDALCVGEGELPFAEYLRRLEAGRDVADIPGIWVRRDGELVRNAPPPKLADLDALPIGDRLIFYDEPNFMEPYDPAILYMRAGRGCPLRCTYCCSPYMEKLQQGRAARMRSPERVIEEVRHALELRPDIQALFFMDETFNLLPRWVREFCEKYGRALSFPFKIMARADTFTPELARRLADAGCVEVWMGVESGSEWLRREVLGRPMSQEKIIRAFEGATAAGLVTACFNMVGLPYETPEMAWETMQLFERLQPDDWQFSIFYPLPRTALYQRCLDEGWITQEQAGSYYERSLLRMPQFSPEEIRRLHETFVGRGSVLTARKYPWGEYDLLAHFEEAESAEAGAGGAVGANYFSDRFVGLFWLVATPPARVAYRVAVKPGREMVFAIGLSPETYYKPGDGVRFRVTINGHRVLDCFLDPKRRTEARGFFEHVIDLDELLYPPVNPFSSLVRNIHEAEGRTQSAEIVFETFAEPSGDPAYCRAGFGRPHVRPKVARSPSPYRSLHQERVPPKILDDAPQPERAPPFVCRQQAT